MKVLLYSPFFFPSVGGVETHSRQLATYLAERGIEVTVATATPGPPENPFPFPVVRRPGPGQLLGLLRWADLLHLNGFAAAPFVLGKVLGKKILWAHLDYDLVCPKGIGYNKSLEREYRLGQCIACLRQDHSPSQTLRRLLAYALRVGAKRAVAAHVCLSRYQQERLRLPQATVIPGSTDVALPARARAANSNTALFIGRLVPEKGCDIFLRALRICADRGLAFRAAIWGDGPSRQELETLADRLDLADRVVFTEDTLSPVNYKGVAKVDMVVVPSVWPEPFGLILVEAMALGKAIIASAVGGMQEMVQGVGLTFPPGDAAALAECLTRVWQDPELRRDLERRAREASRAYTVAAMGERYLALYRQLLGEAHDPPAP